MGRVLTWAVIAVALGGLAWFVFGGRDPAEDGSSDLTAGEPAATRAGDPAGPQLHGAATTASHAAAAGAFAVVGRALGPEGAPRGGLRVVIQENPTVGQGREPGSTTLDDHLAFALRRLQTPTSRQYPLVAETRTDEDGRFRVALPAIGTYRVQAAPEAPWYSTLAWVRPREEEPEVQATLTLGLGTPLRGRVVDGDGAGVAATVTASMWWQEGVESSSWAGGPVETQAATGAFDLAAIPPGNARLTVDFPDGRRLAGIAVEMPHEGELLIRVPAGSASITGTVTGADGAPQIGAHVAIAISRKPSGEDLGGTLTAHATTAEDGTYRMAGLTAGRVTRVQAIAPGHLPFTANPGAAGNAPLDLAEGAALAYDIHLSRGGVVHGRVTAAGGDDPVAGAEVTLMSASGRGFTPLTGLLRATTDADGAYRIPYVAAGRYVALPSREGWFLPELDPARNPTAVPYGTPQAAPATLTVVMANEDGDVERNLQLARGLSVQGRVADGGGRPVEGAEIHAKGYGLAQVAWQWGLQGRSPEPLGRSGPDGTFALVGLPPHNAWVLYAKKEGLVGTYAPSFVLGPDTPAPTLVLTMRAGAVLRGRAEGLAPEDLASASLNYWGTDGELAHKNYGHKLAEDGTFEIRGVPPGDWSLSVYAGGRSGLQLEIKGLQAGEVRAGLVLTLPSGGDVRGILVDPVGKPLAQQPVMLQSATGAGGWTQTQTDADGAFHFAGVAEGSVQLCVFGDGRVVKVGKPFDAPAEGLRFTYAAPVTVTLRGRVVGPDDEPVPLCSVRASANAGARSLPGPMQGPGGVDAVGGTFELQVEGTGPWTLSASDPRGEDGTALNLTGGRATATDPAQPIVLRLLAGQEIGGHVLDEQGKGVAGARVAAGEASVVTTADGAFRLRGLGEPAQQVRVEPPRTWVRPAPQQIPTGTLDAEFRVLPGVAIEGRALGPEDEPLSRGYATARWQSAGGGLMGSQGASLDGEGRFRIEGVPPGVRAQVTVQMWTSTGGQAYASAVVEGVEAGMKDLEVRLGRGLAITGTVMGADGQPAVGCYVFGRAQDGGRMTGYALVDAKGGFELGGLEAEPYTLQVIRQGGGGPLPVSVEVTPPARGVRLQLPRTTTLLGRVAGLSGEAARGWRVRVVGTDGREVGRAEVGADGTFRIDEVVAGTPVHVGASYWQDDRYGLIGPLDPEQVSEVVVPLRDGATLAGVVEDAQASETLTASIQAVRADGWRSTGRVLQDGTFTIRGVPPGTYTLEVTTYGDGRAQRTARRTGVAAGAQDVRIRVP